MFIIADKRHLVTITMAGLDRFPAGSGPGHGWTDQKYVEGDPRRPVNISLDSVPGKKKLAGDPKVAETGDGDKETDKYAGLGIGMTGLLAENLLSHPFIILRRQCQVNVDARR